MWQLVTLNYWASLVCNNYVQATAKEISVSRKLQGKKQINKIDDK